MKLLSVAIPCYNSEAYMSKCINSLLIGGEEVEIIIVDDGSSDRTAEIADDYAEKYPTIVKAIHQENGGHGQAVNTGIKNATGLYFKVVDSDDWVNQDAYYEVLKTLYELIRGAETVDLLISNFVYEKQGATRKKVMQYRHCFPTNQIFGVARQQPVGRMFIICHNLVILFHSTCAPPQARGRKTRGARPDGTSPQTLQAPRIDCESSVTGGPFREPAIQTVSYFLPSLSSIP